MAPSGSVVAGMKTPTFVAIGADPLIVAFDTVAPAPMSVVSNTRGYEGTTALAYTIAPVW